MDKKVISLNLSGRENISPYVKFGAAYEITDANEIPNIPKILKSDVWKDIKKDIGCR